MKQLSFAISANIKDSMFTQPTVKDALDLLEEQYPFYQNLDFLGFSFSSLVLKAKNKDQQVVLKIVYIQDNNYEEIETVQKEYEYLKTMSKNCAFIGIHNWFSLKDKEVEKYFVIEMQICKCSLSQLLQEFRKDKVKLDERVKETLTIQMLDTLNLLHNKEILHRNINPDNIFVLFQPQTKDNTIMLKIGDLGLTPQLKAKNWKFFLQGKKGAENYMAREASQGKWRKESDLYSLGIVILELENYLTFEYSSVSQNEEVTLQENGIKALSKYELNRKSYLFEIAEIFLNPDFKKRQSAQNILERFLQKKQYFNTLLFSIFTETSVASNSQLQLPQFFDKKKQQIAIFNLQIGSYLNNGKSEIIPSADIKFQDHFKFERVIKNQIAINNLNETETIMSISPENIQLALKALYQSKKFALFSFLGRGASGIAFIARNIQQRRDSVLQLSLAKDKIGIMRKVSVLKKAISPYIVQFYGYELFQDENKNEYVWFEYEKCKCTLAHYLNLHKKEINNNPELKLTFALQIIDSVNTLHRQGILHGNIKLDNFMIVEDQSGKETVKLSDFEESGLLSQSSYESDLFEMKDQNYLYQRGKYGTPMFRSPERQFCHGFPSTFISESYSVGICLLLLDNFLSFEKIFLSKYFDLLSPYKIPFKKHHHLMNKKSLIYKWAISLLEYNPNKRLLLRQIVDEIDNYPITLYSKLNSQLNPLDQIYLKTPCLYFNQPNLKAIVQIFNSNLKTFKTSISSLTLNLSSGENYFEEIIQFLSSLSQLCQIQSLALDLSQQYFGSDEFVELSSTLSKQTQLQSLTLNLSKHDLLSDQIILFQSALSKLIQLSSLSLHLRITNIQGKGMIKLPLPTSNQVYLSSLELEIKGNLISSEGMTSLSQDLSKLKYLSFLTLKLQFQLIQSKEIQILSLGLSQLNDLQFLSLDLSDNYINSEGMIYLSQALSKFIKLSTLKLNLKQNQINGEGINSLSTAIEKLKNLLSLTIVIFKNAIFYGGMTQLFSAVSLLTQLTSLTLNIQMSAVEKEELIILSSAISKLIKLSSLTLILANIHIKSEDVILLLSAISQLIQLQSLEFDISDIIIADEGIPLPLPISKMQQLTSFTILISTSNISKEKIFQLPQMLSQLTQLTSLTLDLSPKMTQSDTIIELASALSKLRQLQSLTLGLMGNTVLSEGIIQLSSAISKLIQLSSLTLYLSNRNIESKGMIELSASISKLQNLSSLTLDLYQTNFESEGLESLQSALSKLIKLSSLKVVVSHNNKISDSFMDFLKSQLPQVKKLDIPYLIRF